MVRMIDLDKIDWDKIKSTAGMFKWFMPQPDDERLKILAQHLHDEYLYFSDEYRDYKVIYALFKAYFSWQHGFNLFYEIGDFGGIVGFLNIIPEHKSGLMLKLWNKELWGKQFVREGRELLDFIMDTFALKRVSTETADPEHVIKLAKVFGFKEEGRSPYEVKWNGEYFDNYILGKTKGG